MQKRRGRADKQSGYKGVCWSPVHKKWLARFNRKSRRYHVGLFDNPHIAATALATAVSEYELDLAERARAKASAEQSKKVWEASMVGVRG